MELIKRYQLVFLFGILSVLLFAVAIFTDGTCDSGDSVTHYLYARYAFAHPANFIDHWAKPVFVALASPFAQFGFIGIKIFNVIVSLFTVFFVLRIAKNLGMQNTFLAPVFLLAFPLYFISIFSGLTEPLFGLMLAVSVWLILSGKLEVGLIVISFLPFCRSEGLIVILIAAIYLFLKKNNEKFYLLLIGHIFYSLVGSFHYQYLFWVFDKIPYVGEERYGHGDWLRFFDQSPAIFGIPMLFLLIVGLFSFIRDIAKDRTYGSEKLILIYGSFIALFFAHVIFWRFGWFSSFGLKRVIVAVLPMAAIICLSGINWIADRMKNFGLRTSRITLSLIMVYVISFPFMSNPYAIHLEKDFSLLNDQQAIKEACTSVKQNYPNKKIYSTHYYTAMAMDIDPFDGTKFSRVSTQQDKIEKDEIFIWDNWYAAGLGLNAEDLEKEFSVIKTVEKGGAKIIVFQKK